jgi:YHS domain-containing protein
MIRLLCPTCYSEEIERDEKKQERTGKDYFICRSKSCKTKFHLSKASYSN